MKMVPSAESFFGVMKQEFPHYLKNSFFKRTKEPCLYLYEIESSDIKAYGLVTSTSVNDILDNKILKHEHTLAKKEQQMLDLALQRNAMIKPVLLAHKHNKKLQNIYAQIAKRDPFLTIPFTEENAIHKIWKIKQLDRIKNIQKLFKDEIPKVYIADGHHRVSTGILLNKTKVNTKAEFGDLLSIYLSFEHLKIYDYSKIVSILKEITPVQLITKLSKFFDIKPIDKVKIPKKKHRITFLIGKEVYQLKWKRKFIDLDQDIILDAELLNKHIFSEIMGIHDARTDQRIKNIGGKEGAEAVISSLLKDDYAIGFILFPVTKKELMGIANKGETLPPKSTWFEPRIKNAIISQEFE